MLKTVRTLLQFCHVNNIRIKYIALFPIRIFTKQFIIATSIILSFQLIITDNSVSGTVIEKQSGKK